MLKLFDHDFFKLFIGFLIILMVSFVVFYFTNQLNLETEKGVAASQVSQ